VEEELLAAGAKVVEDNPKGSVTLRPVRKTIYKKKPKAINVDKNLSEAGQKRVNGLVSMFIGMGSYKPAGILTDAFKAEWKQTCRRVAEKKVKDAEKATIDRVVNTWLELRTFLESRGRPAPPRDGGPGPVSEAHPGASSSTRGLEVDEQECRPGAGPEQSAGANHTQGDWAAWPSTSGGASAIASFGGPQCGIACGWR